MQMSSRVKNRIGKRYGQLVVVAYKGLTKDKKNTLWECLCDCGVTRVIRSTSLEDESCLSCGCYRKSKLTTHALTKTREYEAWCQAKGRCRPDDSRRKHYFDRGITMCKEWAEDFTAFLESLGSCPEGFTLDRIDNNKGYQPGNCRWVSHKTQCNNRTSNRLITHDGTTLNLSEWAEKTGLTAGTICYRLKSGWPIHLAVDNTITISQARQITKIHGGSK